MAAMAEPMAKVREMVPLTEMPIRDAASRSWEQASMACPGLVLLIKVCSAATRITLTTMETMVVPGIIKGPTGIVWKGTTEVNILVSDPKTSRAAFCRK